MTTSIKRVTTAAAFGTALEWYDFFLYGTAAALVFPALFFPESDPMSGTLLSFGVYATGFAARPLGGIVFGHLGDRIGRRNVLFATLVLMGVATVTIGLLPTYAQIGVAAPILLVVMRILQGLGTGGEWGGAALLTREHARGRLGFWGSLLSSAVFVGMVIGSSAFTVLGFALSNDALMSWGWRIPFLFSAVLVAAGIYLRLRVEESPEFDEVKRAGRQARMPLLEALRSPRNIIAIFLMRVGQNTSFYTIAVFALVYVTKTLGLPDSTFLVATVIGAGMAALMCPVWGIVGDRVGFRKVMAYSLLFQALFAFPFFALLETRNTVVVILAVTIAIAGAGAASDAIQPAYFTSMFGTKVRYSGVSIGREGGTVVGGGLSPLLATAMLTWGFGAWPIAAWMVITSVIGLAAVFLARPLADAEDTEATETSQHFNAAPAQAAVVS